jgi:hypothetical protein
VEEFVEEEIIINNIDAMEVIEQKVAEDAVEVDVEVVDNDDDNNNDGHFDDDNKKILNPTIECEMAT